MSTSGISESSIAGLHHVTAIAGDPQRNVDFYSGVLGLRLVKVTVNFDDPGTYHFYYGDGVGTPGTILTFFPWSGLPSGRLGAGQTQTTAFAVTAESIADWKQRLQQNGIAIEESDRYGNKVLSFQDHDGLKLELVGSATGKPEAIWANSPVSADMAIQRFHGVALAEGDPSLSADFLTGKLGFKENGSENGRRLFLSARNDGGVVELIKTPSERGRVAVGSVHHIAWRTAGDQEQLGWQERLRDRGVTDVLDRQYFRSIYFREPGGVLFEIATDPPGFTKDETPEHLGSALKLPPWLDRSRQEVRGLLPEFTSSEGVVFP